MTGGMEEGTEVRSKNMCDERKEAETSRKEGWRHRTFVQRQVKLCIKFLIWISAKDAPELNNAPCVI